MTVTISCKCQWRGYTADLIDNSCPNCGNKFQSYPLLITEYVPLDKQLFLDAEKYSKRAIEYLEKGMLSHAAGCAAKACKKLNKAEKFANAIGPTPEFMRIFINNLAKRVAENILKS
jgi:hypothetical protein